MEHLQDQCHQWEGEIYDEHQQLLENLKLKIKMIYCLNLDMVPLQDSLSGATQGPSQLLEVKMVSKW